MIYFLDHKERKYKVVTKNDFEDIISNTYIDANMSIIENLIKDDSDVYVAYNPYLRYHGISELLWSPCSSKLLKMFNNFELKIIKNPVGVYQTIKALIDYDMETFKKLDDPYYIEFDINEQ